jgi:acyl-CoA synthetase (AMP-forming)/AMP-acid ligase II
LESLSIAVESAVLRNAVRNPSKIACSDGRVEITHAQLALDVAETRRRAKQLFGDCAGDAIVLIQAESSYRFLRTVVACHIEGVVVVPISATATPREVVAFVSTCGASAVISARADVRASVEALPSALAVHPEAVLISDGDSPVPEHRRRILADDLAFGIFTSGSTGRPKGIGFTQRQMSLLVHTIADRLRYRADDVVYCALPLAFDYGYYQLLLSLTAGCHVALAEAGAGAVIPRVLAQRNVTVLPVVPTLLRMYLTAAQRSRVLPPLRIVTNTGERLPAPLQELVAEVHPEVTMALMYGLSECKRVSIGLYAAAELPRDDVGTPLSSHDVTVRDPQGRTVRPGELGEIVVRGPAVSRIDLADRQRQGLPLDRERWLRTGDFGRIDELGLLYVEGRRGDLFKNNGIRVSKLEIERAAERVPGVLQAYCGPDAAGELKLWVAGSVSAPDLLEALRGELDSVKIPSATAVVDRIPVNVNGKFSPKGTAR